MKQTAFEKLPRHLAFIMDGNGRWAQKRLLPREAGHKKGVQTVQRVVKYCRELGIPCLTFFAFSTENWKRPKSEIEALFGIFRDYLEQIPADYVKENIRLRVLGEISAFPEDLAAACQKAEAETAGCDGMFLNIALNYGSRAEIARAANLAAAEGPVTEESLSRHLYTAGLPDPDLLIRTSGEMRLSNFLLFQLAYAELWFTQTPWPAFGKRELDEALEAYAARSRRFGGLKG